MPDSVKSSRELASRPCEKCGGQYALECQGIGWSEADKCVADFLEFVCRNCGHELNYTVRVQSMNAVPDGKGGWFIPEYRSGMTIWTRRKAQWRS